ncbi:MAG: FtsX-like permease family protein, partial [Candidatus Pacebacteria bacterium]|nr:FtsX-like permease family protein [Candidatus Paceibacterota bacterium]
DELGENPLGAVLNIKAEEIGQYAGIADFLKSETVLVKGNDSIIEKINYYQNKTAINKLNKIINAVNKFGLTLAIILMIISTLITFNTIRLAIYISREEIKVMRLVGANNSYIRGPFIFEGVIYGALSALLTTILFYPFLFWLNPFIENMFFIDLLAYYSSHLLSIFATTLVVGIFVGVLSSLLAVRKYLFV